EDVFSGLPETLSRACAELEELIQNGLRARVVREGAKVVLVGRPNAGKSSLYNALLGQDRAIVTQYPGTTRDVLTEPTQFLGLPVLLTDTAGLRPTHEPVERIGVERAQAALEQAEFLLLVLDSSQALAPEDVALIEETDGRPRLGVLAKADLPPALDEEELAVLGLPSLRVSAVTGLGLPALCRRVAEQLLPEDYPVWITNARHIQALERAREALGSALSSREPDCVATDLTAALAELYSITGQSVSEEVIARIFRRFCVGK
ncbi:MAG: GTP-binding protein, partial [Clostridiales bacterium]|nr:GTP-binding protein [Clostridiales bacterium]